ncbi:MAG TPA: uroporphyrinogen-III synthase [Polyangia bacterium]|nr:uroporphyrinogen-III synthase [Polyangia bacterium]
MTLAERPLAGWRILVTRPADQIPPFAAALEAAGAEAIAYPTIAVEPPPSWEALDGALKKIAAYQWVIFTSPSAVRFTLARAAATGAAAPALTGLKVAAVGAQTARALAAAGIAVDVVPDSDQRQEGLLAALTALPPGTRVLFPQAVGGRDLLAQRLTEQGCLVDVVPVSRTTSLPLAGTPPPFDLAVFASPSAFRAFVDGHGLAPLGGRLIAAIGPTTAAAIVDAGVTVDVVPDAPSAAAMVSALIAFRRDRRGTPV